MFKGKQRNLRQLLKSFNDAFGKERIMELESFVDHGEYGIAIELLSSWIYDEDIAVTAAQEAAILKSSADHGVDAEYHAFIGRTPPYPDLRSPEMIAVSERAMNPSMENVKYFAQANQMLIAVKMYREITGASLEEALASVERINASSD
jgi:hypothetical protein